MRKKLPILFILTTILFLFGCSSAEQSAPEAIDRPVEETSSDPGYLDVTGRTEQNQAFRGNPDAPVTLTDYTDFM